MPSSSPPRRFGSAGLLAGLVLTAAGVQAVLGAWTIGPRLAHIPIDVVRYRDDAVEPAPNEAVAAMRALPPLARQLPADARVLAVSGLFAAVQLEYWFLPRPFRLLQAWPEHLIETVEKLVPEAGPVMRQRRVNLEASGTLLDPARLAAALRTADYVLVAGTPPPEWAAVTEGVVLRDQRPGFSLYEVQR